MFLSATRIEKNKAAGLGVAGRRMRRPGDVDEAIRQVGAEPVAAIVRASLPAASSPADRRSERVAA